MIFGKSYDEIDQTEQLKLQSMKNGKIWFAWYPVRENNGKWVWLQKVKVEWLIYKDGQKLRLSSVYGRTFYLINQQPTE